MSDEIRMTLLHHSTNDLIEELLMWKGLAAAHLDHIAELEYQLEDWTNNGWAEDYKARIAELEEAQRKRFNCRTDDSNTLSSMTPIENSFYSYAELTEEQKIRFAAYQVFDMPKKASSNIKDTVNSGKPEVTLLLDIFISNGTARFILVAMMRVQ